MQEPSTYESRTNEHSTNEHSTNEHNRNDFNNKYIEFTERFNEYIKKKYSPNESLTRPLSYLVPALIAFIGAYSMLIECLTTTLINLINEFPIFKQLVNKLFIFYINAYEFYKGMHTFITNLTDEDSNSMLNSSYQDLISKINRCATQIAKVIVNNCDELINEKMTEFSEVD